jgi:transketolase
MSQDVSAVFRGTEIAIPRSGTSTAGIPVATVPAFVAGEELARLSESDERIVVLTADLASANRTTDFRDRHPERFFNIGIAEHNMVTIAAGMASSGLVPFVATFAAFAALMCCEQIRTDCAYPGLPVRVLGHHSGMSMGFYGTSHHSLEDLGIMRTIADLTVVCATDANHLRAVLRKAVDYPGAMYIRLGRGRDPEVYADVPPVEFGRAIRVREGTDVTLIATGSEVRPALDAANMLAEGGVSVRVLDMHTIRPLDGEAVIDAARQTGGIVTVEEHNVTGGLGSAVGEVLADAAAGVRFLRHGVPDEHVLIGPPKALYRHYRLDAGGIADVTRQFLRPKVESQS